MSENNKITVGVRIHAPIEKVWEFWTKPEYIVKWNQASEDWHTPYAENDLRKGGRFLSRMESKDKSQGFDMTGTYDEVKPLEKIVYTMDDGRAVTILFTAQGQFTELAEVFEAETTFPAEYQKEGWQSILDQFKQFTEQ